jgi:hypothetical protein
MYLKFPHSFLFIVYTRDMRKHPDCEKKIESEGFEGLTCFLFLDYYAVVF